jgi:hypothetical protein
VGTFEHCEPLASQTKIPKLIWCCSRDGFFLSLLFDLKKTARKTRYFCMLSGSSESQVLPLPF